MSIERIANRQLFIILFIIRSILAISTLPSLTSADALQDAWISQLLIYLPVAFFLVWPLAALGTRFPRQSFVQYSITIMGPWLGRAVAAIYLWIFLFYAALEVRIYGAVIITGFLPETPLLFIVSAMVFTSAVAAYLGIEVIGRMADILFPFFIITVLLTLFLPLPLADPGNLQPVLARGWGPVMRGALTPIGSVIEFGLLAFLTPSLVRPRRSLPWIFGALVASTLLSAASVAVVVMIKGPLEGARAAYPLLAMVRAVRISHFLERAESLSIFAWGLAVFISLSAYIFSGARGIAQFFNIGNYRPLIPPMALIWVAMAVHMLDDSFQLDALMEYRVMGLYGISLMVLPLALLWTTYGIRSLLGRLGLPGGMPNLTGAGEEGEKER